MFKLSKVSKDYSCCTYFGFKWWELILPSLTTHQPQGANWKPLVRPWLYRGIAGIPIWSAPTPRESEMRGQTTACWTAGWEGRRPRWAGKGSCPSSCYLLSAYPWRRETFILLVRSTVKLGLILDCGAGEDSWESLGLQGDPTSPS